jgi:hypothetical protein
MRVLIACEASGVVRRAFAARGHDAWSVDVLPAEDGSNQHLVGDARNYLGDGWDLLAVFHPPCTRLCKSGVRWLHVPPKGRTLEEMWTDLDEAADLFSAFWNAPIPRRCVENPAMHRHGKQRILNYAEPAQRIQPWQFGHCEVKETCLWLTGLPPLQSTRNVHAEMLALPRKHRERTHFVGPGPQRWRHRSRTLPGIAEAMADQWGSLDDIIARRPPHQPCLFGEVA